jgi:hypothetical protein
VQLKAYYFNGLNRFVSETSTLVIHVFILQVTQMLLIADKRLPLMKFLKKFLQI